MCPIPAELRSSTHHHQRAMESYIPLFGSQGVARTDGSPLRSNISMKSHRAELRHRRAMQSLMQKYRCGRSIEICRGYRLSVDDVPTVASIAERTMRIQVRIDLEDRFGGVIHDKNDLSDSSVVVDCFRCFECSNPVRNNPGNTTHKNNAQFSELILSLFFTTKSCAKQLK